MDSLLKWIEPLSPVHQTLIATLFTWSITALGASAVFFVKRVQKRILDAMLGFAAGVMVSASFWSLLAPALELSQKKLSLPWIPLISGFLAGGLFIFVADKILPHQHPSEKTTEGIKTGWHRSILLVLAITLHNIPEGFAIGVSFGNAAIEPSKSSLLEAIALALGIGLQNFPEGLVVSIPLKREGLSSWKSFFYGQLSAIVEPIAGTMGAFLVLLIEPILPYALSFAAGAMIFVVIEELIPESQANKSSDLSSISAIIGFAIMMLMDIALG